MDRTAGPWIGGLPLVAGGDPRTRELVRRAVRDGRTGDPQVDQLVRAWLHRWRQRRWLLPLPVLCCLVAAAWTDDAALRVVVGVGAVLTLIAAWSVERCHRRLRAHHGAAAGEC